MRSGAAALDRLGDDGASAHVEVGAGLSPTNVEVSDLESRSTANDEHQDQKGCDRLATHHGLRLTVVVRRRNPLPDNFSSLRQPRMYHLAADHPL
jgi:hypothetical protein